MPTLPLSATDTLRLRLALAAVQQAEMQVQYAREQLRWLVRELLLRAGQEPEGQQWELDLDRQQLVRAASAATPLTMEEEGEDRATH